MHKKRLTIALSLAAGLVSTVQAADWFPGQTGQYHVIPVGQDYQNLTLVGSTDASCPQDTVALFSVDEFGNMDNVPFAVPSNTVFILTDAMFTGLAKSAPAGYTPALNIAQTNATGKVSFLASRQLQGAASEQITGAGFLQSGAAFATNSKLCAQLDFAPGGVFGGVATLNLESLEVHGKLIDNLNTDGLSW